MLSEPCRSLTGRIVLGTLATGAALSLSACGQLPLLPPALSGDSADGPSSSEPTEEESPEETEPPEEPTEEPSDEETMIEEPTEPADPEDVDVFSVNVGDCLNEMESEDQDAISEVPKVDCEEPHDFEVYDDPQLEDEDNFPGRDEVIEMADEACLDSFEDFIGIEWGDSALEFTTLYPTQEGWEDYDDREVLCLVIDPAGQTEGTLENARF